MLILATMAARRGVERQPVTGAGARVMAVMPATET